VCCHRHEINGKIFNVDRYVPGSLDGIAVEEHSVAATYVSDLFYGLNSAYLVISEMNGYQYGVRANGAFKLIRSYHAVLVDRQDSYIEALLGEPVTCIQHSVVFYGRSYDVSSLSFLAKATPFMARLSASLPPPVKIISAGSAFISCAT